MKYFARIGTCSSALTVAVASLALVAGSARAADAPAQHPQVAVLAGGCFWGMEDVFEQLSGVSSVVAGYSGGTSATADYETVSSGTTGHAESVQITYDPSRISYQTLLEVYFRVAHDPTERDRQGLDEGTQYRSVIFYGNEAQHRAALDEIASLTKRKAFANPIVTEVVPLKRFYRAEEYHQHYAERNPNNPYIAEVDAPKVSALESTFPKLVKPSTLSSTR